MSRLLLTGCALSALSLLPQATAKDIVVPKWAAVLEAPSRTQFPWGVHKLRYQQVFDRASLPTSGTAIIKSLGYRVDGGSTNIGHTITADLELMLSTTTAASANLSTVFSKNQGPDLTTVISRQKVMIDGFKALTGSPTAFAITLILSKPFTYKAGTNLLLETRIWGNQGGQWTNWDFNCWMDAVDQKKGPMRYFGNSCPGTAGWPAVTAMEAQIHQRAMVQLWSAPIGSQTVCLYGINKDSYGPVKLPFSLAGVGATGCSLHLEPVIMVPAKVGGNGLAEAPLPLPLNIHLRGLSLYAQYLVLDAKANAAGLTASGAVEMTLAAPAHTGFVWATDPTASSGVSSSYKAPVTRFTW